VPTVLRAADFTAFTTSNRFFFFFAISRPPGQHSFRLQRLG
jgi:hypothetical protein